MSREVHGIRRTVMGIDCVECPDCKTDYNRELVIAEIRKQSPFLFGFGGWTTKFECQICGTHIVISSND